MNDLEFLRETFKDIRQHVGIGLVTQTGLAADNSKLRVKVSLFPDKREIVCFMGFADVYDVTFPEINDLVLVSFADGDPDEAHVIGRFPAKDQPIPTFAQTGHSVKYSRKGKKLYLGSDTKICLSKIDVEPTEPVVLGNVLKTFLTTVLDTILNAPQVGWVVGIPVFLDPDIRTALVAAKAVYLTTTATNIESQIAFTERGA